MATREEKSLMDRDTVIDFVENKLEIPGIEQQLSSDRWRVHLLDSIIRQFLNKVPFQNVTLVKDAPEERRIPTKQESIDMVLSGKGGMCWTLNYFMYDLLKVLGFEVLPFGAIVGRGSETDCHLLLMVSGLLPDRAPRIVDVGFGYPLFSSVPLNFEDESPEYCDGSSLTYKFVKERNMIYHLHKKGKGQHFPAFNEGWNEAYSFENHPKSIDAISQSIGRSEYTYDPNSTQTFHSSIRLIRFKGDKMIAVKNMELILEDSSHKFQATKFDSKQDLVKEIGVHFPELEETEIVSAYNNVFPDIK